MWAGHGALALGMGLAIGLGVWARRRRRNWLAYLIPVVVFLWVVWEHMMANWYGGAACSSRPSALCTLSSVGLRGRVFPIAVLIGIGVAIYLSRGVIRSHRAADPAMVVAAVDRAGYSSRGWRGSLGLIRDQLDFRRWRRKTAYGAFHLEHTERVPTYQALSVLASRTRAFLIEQRLTGGEPHQPPATVQDMIVALIPVE